MVYDEIDILLVFPLVYVATSSVLLVTSGIE